MRRGDLVVVSAQGDYGKPQPAVVIQNDRLIDLVPSDTVCFLTSDIEPNRHLRIEIEPSPENGLRIVSQVQIDKIMTFPKAKAQGPIGRLSGGEMIKVDQGLLTFLDLMPPILTAHAAD